MRYAIVDSTTKKVFVVCDSEKLIEEMFKAWKTPWGIYQIVKI